MRVPPVGAQIRGALDALAATNDPSKQLEEMLQYKQAKAYFASCQTSATANLLDTTA